MEKTGNPITEAANRMLERFGGDAVREVETRITELLEHGETEVAAFWQQVLDTLIDIRIGSSDQTKH